MSYRLCAGMWKVEIICVEWWNNMHHLEEIRTSLENIYISLPQSEVKIYPVAFFPKGFYKGNPHIHMFIFHLFVEHLHSPNTSNILKTKTLYTLVCFLSWGCAVHLMGKMEGHEKVGHSITIRALVWIFKKILYT